MLKPFLAATALLLASLPASAETVTFKAKDGVTITGDVTGPESKTVLVLFHMAGSSRGEYRAIAPHFHKLGYRTLAVDQRSGGWSNDVENQTAKRVGSDPGFLAAKPDLKAAVAYARDTLGAERLGVIGSSYSASLVLVLAGQSPGFADAVMSFSPGEYFPDRSLVATAATQITVPVFITAARNETGQWQPIFDQIEAPKTGFVPEGRGRHGAGVLTTGDKVEYFAALDAFLREHLPAE